MAPICSPETLTDRRRDITTDKAYEDASALAAPEVMAEESGRVTLVAHAGNVIKTMDLYVSNALATWPWLEPALKRAGPLLLLPTGWNGDGAPMIDRASIRAAVAALAQFMKAGSSIPQWTPTNKGGVQLDWHERGMDLEIAFEPDDLAGYAVFEDRQRNLPAWDGPVDVHLMQLRAIFERLLVG
jgi:hypothetical protein